MIDRIKAKEKARNLWLNSDKEVILIFTVG